MQLRIVLAASAFGALSFAGPGFGASFDCGKASTPTERAICGDTQLSAADSEMATVYAATLAQLSPEGQHFVTEAQRVWVHLTRRGVDIIAGPDSEHRRRDQVRFLTGLYRERIAQLKQSAVRFGPYVWSRVDSYRFGVGSNGPSLASNNVPRIAWIYTAYPRIDHPESAAALAVNAKLKATSVQSFQYGEDAFGCGLGENGSGGGETEHVGNLSFANSKLVSVVWSNDDYCFGAAHGQGSTNVTNFVFAPELRPMRPEDIFKPGSRWPEVLEQNADAAFLDFRINIEEKLQRDEMNGVRDAVSRVNGWSLTPEGIQFAFDPYSFGGYASGGRFTVPWAKLRSVLRPESSLGDAQN